MTWEDLLHILRVDRAARVRAAVLLAAVLAVVVVLAVCVAMVLEPAIARYGAQPSLTLDEAKTQAAVYAQQAQAQMPGHPRFIGPARTSTECDGNAPRNSVDLADTYDVDYSEVPGRAGSTTAIDSTYNFWAFNGYTVLTDTRFGTMGRRIIFENPRDGFRFGLIESDAGSELTLQISAPCVRAVK